MINKIHIHALKSIKDMTVSCSKINFLVGTNSSGKSTFLQAILLAAQNSLDRVGLNGKLLSLGEYREVRNYYMNNDSIKIELWTDNKKKPSWIEFKEDKEKKDTYRVISSEYEDEEKEKKDKYRVISSEYEDAENIINDILFDFGRDSDKSLPLVSEYGLHYLSCHRIGPEDIYAKNMIDNDDFGIDGEYTLAYLLKNETNPIDSKLVIKNEELTESFLDQVNYWLQHIVGMKLSINDLKKTNYLQVKYSNNFMMNSETMFSRPVNVGSGVSYLVSILITCLASKKDDIIIIENPEIHLHPKAQSRLCDFLYFISQANRQLFIETHSDHIFNGIRVGTATKSMKQEDLTVSFFALKNYETLCNPIKFGEFGKIIGTNDDMDIDDLFDQFEIDLDKMIGI